MNKVNKTSITVIILSVIGFMAVVCSPKIPTTVPTSQPSTQPVIFQPVASQPAIVHPMVVQPEIAASQPTTQPTTQKAETKVLDLKKLKNRPPKIFEPKK